ncbi:phasin family protein [Micromonospora sp. CA-244673]|uniref:phasin family protein n=1 Tax=Micromonospora sp. CA-244673 TaxID=3239958 RepID=UPI003D89C0D1
MQDAWRAYLELAMGLTEAPRKKAQDAVKRVVGQGGATAAQLQSLAEELVSTGMANREALTKLVRFEVDRALGAVGLATADEVAELTRRVHDLERQLREAKTPAAEAGAKPAAGPESDALRTPASPPLAAETAGAGEVTPSGEPTATGPAEGEPGAERPAPAAPAAEAPVSAPPVPARTKAVAKKAVAKKAIAKKPAATVAKTPAEESPAAPVRPAKKSAGRKPTGGAAS